MTDVEVLSHLLYKTAHLTDAEPKTNFAPSIRRRRCIKGDGIAITTLLLKQSSFHKNNNCKDSQSPLETSFTVHPTATMKFYTRGNRYKGQVTETWTNFTFFVLGMFCLALALSFHQGDFFSQSHTNPSLFLGTRPVSAAVATAALSTSVARSSRTTMVTMAAGSSRTLIELTNQENDNNGEFQFELTYLDEDEENGLLVLRKANVDTSHQSKSVVKGGCAVFDGAVRTLKNPIVFLVVAGNIASMTGILPPGIAGFLPAVGIFLRNKTKWATPLLGKMGSLRFGKGIFLKLKAKLTKAISNLYKNRSKYSLLGDCLWHVDFDEKKSKDMNGKDHIDGGATPSTYKAVA